MEPETWASVRALREGRTTLNELLDIETFDGHKKTIQNSAAPIRNAEGAIQGAVIVNEDVTERVRAEEALRHALDRLHHLSRRLLEVQEDERRHIARELHDEFGQLLATITLHLHAARSAAGEAAQASLAECMGLLRQAGEQVRTLAPPAPANDAGDGRAGGDVALACRTAPAAYGSRHAGRGSFEFRARRFGHRLLSHRAGGD